MVDSLTLKCVVVEIENNMDIRSIAQWGEVVEHRVCFEMECSNYILFYLTLLKILVIKFYNFKIYFHMIYFFI